MKNLDFLQKAKKEFAEKLNLAFKNNDEEAITEAFEGYANSVQQAMLDTVAEIKQTADNAILAKRGVRQLTDTEQKFYNNIVTSAKSNDPKQALTGIEATIPQTVIDSVLEDISNEHPFLNALNIQNTYGSIKVIFAKDIKQLATWGTLNSSITKQLEGSIDVKEFGMSKLTAYIPVPLDMLDLGASYIDAYVRKILADAWSYGLENGFINGTGKNQPIGLTKNPEGAVVSGEYPDKTAEKLKDLSVTSYMKLIGDLAKGKEGAEGEADEKTKAIAYVDLVVNPVDYLTKIVPATTVMATDGTYKNNIFPFPTNVYQSEMMEEGKAVIGQLKRYKACVSSGKNGKIEYSDEFQFLDDNRVYKIKGHAEGFALNDNDFKLLDISELEPLELKVTIEDKTAGKTADKT